MANGNAVRPDLAPGHFLFTSESVGEGHPGMSFSLYMVPTLIALPDKICDQVSDAIVSNQVDSFNNSFANILRYDTA
jgi:S-adenosylmethionine synthetase